MEHISAILANCWWMILLSALIAYLLGSINTAVLVTGIVTKGKGYPSNGQRQCRLYKCTAQCR